MKKITQKVCNTLNNKICRLDKVKYDEGFVKDPLKDFSRKRKLLFPDMIRSLIFSSGKPLKEELLVYYDYDSDTASDAAYIKARDKIRAEAFAYLMKELNKVYVPNKTYKGYQLVGVDGSDLSVFYDPDDEYTYYYLGEEKKAHSQMHINSSYDLLSKRYLDCIIQGVKDKNEPLAMYQMAQRSVYDDQIYIADRMYPTLNNMEHLSRAKKKFVMRLKDIFSAKSFYRKFDLPKGEFDEDVSIILTNRRTKEVLSHPDKYCWLNPNSNFDFLDESNHFYPVTYRIVRFRLTNSDEYETLITNLDRRTFSVDDLKYLYRIRWDHEVSFRHLKYAANLNALQSKKRLFIKQEIFAKMILYNISMIIMEYLSDRKKSERKKYECAFDITSVIHIIREKLRKRKGGIPPNLEDLILKQLLPVRPDRKFERNTRWHSAIGFNYRFS